MLSAGAVCYTRKFTKPAAQAAVCAKRHRISSFSISSPKKVRKASQVGQIDQIDHDLDHLDTDLQL